MVHRLDKMVRNWQNKSLEVVVLCKNWCIDGNWEKLCLLLDYWSESGSCLLGPTDAASEHEDIELEINFSIFPFYHIFTIFPIYHN